MTDQCVIEPSGCVVCPAIAAVEGVPARTEILPVRAWSAGANSVTTLHDENLRVRFSVDQAVGVICGLARPPRTITSDPTSVDYGWYCFTSPSGSTLLAQPIERGTVVGSPITRPADAVFEVRRVHGVVSYLMDDAPQHTSGVPSVGALLVGAALYASGDTIL